MRVYSPVGQGRGLIMSTPARNRGSSNVGTYALTFNHDEVVRLLKAAVEREGSQLAYAKRHGLDRAHLKQNSEWKETCRSPRC